MQTAVAKMNMVVAIALLLSLSALVACSTPEANPAANVAPTVNLDATVTARVNATSEANQALETAVADAIESTRAAEPTLAPVPTATIIPSATPTSVPVPATIPPRPTPKPAFVRPTATQVPASPTPEAVESSKIAFSSERFWDEEFGNAQIWVMNADGSNPSPLRNLTGFDAGASWSPDGQFIAFYSDHSLGSDPKSHIFVVSASDSVSSLFVAGNELNYAPNWSANGEQLVFASNRFESKWDDGAKYGEYGDFEIYVMDSDGENVTRLTNNVGLQDRTPTWSPDGKKIAYISNDESNVNSGWRYMS